MRTSGNNYVFPTQPLAVFGDEIVPPALRIFLRQPFHKLKRAFHHSVRLRNIDFVAEVLSGGRFQTDVATTVFRNRLFFATDSEPPVSVVRLNGMQAIAVESIK